MGAPYKKAFLEYCSNLKAGKDINRAETFLAIFGQDGCRLVTQLAWAAGLFEGEGTFTVHKSRNPTKINGYTHINIYPCAAICMTDNDVLMRFQRIVGFGTVNGPYRDKLIRADGKPRKSIYQWSVINWRAKKVIDMFRPFLLSRRLAQIDTMISKCGKFETNDPRERREK